MFTYESVALKDVDYISLAANQSSTSSFIAGTFQPGQVVPTSNDLCSTMSPSYDCCFATKFTAAACYAQSQNLNYIPAYTFGNGTLIAGSFELNVTVAQSSLQILFATDVTDFSVDTVTTGCSDITFFD
jgi:hypothetical protein